MLHQEPLMQSFCLNESIVSHYWGSLLASVKFAFASRFPRWKILSSNFNTSDMSWEEILKIVPFSGDTSLIYDSYNRNFLLYLLLYISSKGYFSSYTFFIYIFFSLYILLRKWRDLWEIHFQIFWLLAGINFSYLFLPFFLLNLWDTKFSVLKII